MIIYPAIDLKDGKCVRLYKGDMARDTVYNDDPAAQGLEWARAGFSWLHVVDLNGAIAGAPANHRAVRDIIAQVDLPVQLGGGIRSMKQIEHWLQEEVMVDGWVEGSSIQAIFPVLMLMMAVSLRA